MGAIWFVLAALLGYAVVLDQLRRRRGREIRQGEACNYEHERERVDYDSIINVV